MTYCTCESPIMDVEHDAGCRRCGLPVDFSPKPVVELGNAGFGVRHPNYPDAWLADGYDTPHEALSAAESNAPLFYIGARVRLRHDVDRYPHFIAPAGALGTVTTIDDVYCVRMDDNIDGAGDWDNEVLWSLTDGDDPIRDLVIAE